MALRNLTTQLMVSFSKNWIDADKERPIIERYPIARALLPRLEEAHGNLLAFQRKSLDSQGEIAAIQREQARLDAEHDRKIRGVYNYLMALAELSDTEEEARNCLELRDLLLPDGLQAIIRSYAEESGEILLLQQRLSARAILDLRNIPVRGGNLYDHVDAWMKAGLMLGKLDEKRTDILKTLGESETKQADVARARNEWIRTVHALRANLDLDRASAEDMERLFRYLDQAETKADRGAAVPASKGETPPGDPKAGASPEPPPTSAPPAPMVPPPCANGGQEDESSR